MNQTREKNIKKSIEGYLQIASDDRILFESLIQKDPRVEIFWQNSVVAGEIIKWYPFDLEEQIAVFDDIYSNYKNVLKEKGLKIYAPIDNEMSGCKCKYVIFNVRPFPTQRQVDVSLIKYKLDHILKYICEDGILLLLCSTNDTEQIKELAEAYGFDKSNLYDPLYIGLCVFELSKKELSDKRAFIPSEIQAQKLLSCPWTNEYGIPMFGETLERRDEDFESINRVKEIELDLLKTLKNICDKHDLHLYLMYGSLLGAARSAGVIDGDDDIDVALLREDFDKLVSVKDEFETPYFLQVPAGDDCFFGGYLKLRNENTTAITPENWWINCCEGIGIDIFPIDYGFEDVKREKRKIFRIKQIQRLLYAKAYGYFANFLDMKLLKWKSYTYLSKLFSKEQLSKWLNRELSSGEDKKDAPIGIYAHYQGDMNVRYIEKKALKSETLLSFENMTFCVPGGWDKILRRFYGDGYMDVEPWKEYKRRHGFYSVDEPYPVYLERFHGLHRLKSAEGKEIVLFGVDILMELYLKRYSDVKYHPTKIVIIQDEEYELIKMQKRMNADDNDLQDDNTYNMLDNFEKISLNYFEDKNLSLYYPIICAIDVRRIEKILQETGFKDYYIYWENREWMLRANLSSVRKDLLQLEGK